MAKSYKSFTGLSGFKYKVEGSTVSTVEEIDYIQEVSVSKEQSIEKAYGANKIAEMAVTNGTVELESTFHKLPLEDRTAIFGLTKSDSGVIGVGNDTPPYVAVMFEKTMEDGSVEYVGLPKGIFTFAEFSGNTKEDSVEFSQDSSTGEFMQAKVEGFEKEQTMLLGHDEAGSTTMRDAIHEAVFGVAHPEAGSGLGA
ncbi:phage tail protein [Mammaliicoccus vitulinus]|uniref:major tail protein n=1 Tax=Mammaliicoccus vitulinus TaxID=71237 RepID=UPI00194F8481|nr:major tail protein [Mammaliicoccus vitulinus]MBM6630303.1 phage tail protein [Mammaliicoccus vitulinus]